MQNGTAPVIILDFAGAKLLRLQQVSVVVKAGM